MREMYWGSRFRVVNASPPLCGMGSVTSVVAILKKFRIRKLFTPFLLFLPPRAPSFFVTKCEKVVTQTGSRQLDLVSTSVHLRPPLLPSISLRYCLLEAAPPCHLLHKLSSKQFPPFLSTSFLIIAAIGIIHLRVNNMLSTHVWSTGEF